jgi:hypothetical protein
VNNKKIYFLCSLPRAGNTLLGALINQNSNLNITSNSILPEVVYQLYLIKENQIFKNFPDQNSLDNIINKVFDNYYKDWKADYIIDRGPWGTPMNLYILKKIKSKRKFIILYRPILECLASFIKIEKPADVEERCRCLMQQEGIIGKSLLSIKNIIKEKENYILINYFDLIKNPMKEINKIYEFLKIDLFNHTVDKINQFSVNGIKYDDSVLIADLHKIRTDNISFSKYNIEEVLSKNILNKYSGLDIL